MVPSVPDTTRPGRDAPSLGLGALAFIASLLLHGAALAALLMLRPGPVSPPLAVIPVALVQVGLGGPEPTPEAAPSAAEAPGELLASNAPAPTPQDPADERVLEAPAEAPAAEAPAVEAPAVEAPAVETPAVEPAVPAVEPAAPAVEPAVLAVEPAAPAVEPAVLAVEPAAPAVEPAVLAVEPAAPAVEPAVLAVEPAAPAVEPAVPTVEAASWQPSAPRRKPPRPSASSAAVAFEAAVAELKETSAPARARRWRAASFRPSASASRGRQAAAAGPAAGDAAGGQVASLVPARYDGGGLSNPAPRYPHLARRRGHEGRVVLRVSVTADGRPGSVVVLRSSGHRLLDEAALQAVLRWRFQPARRGGDAVEGQVDVPVAFRLTE